MCLQGALHQKEDFKMEFSCDSTRFGKHYCTMLLSMYKAALTPWPYVGVVNQSWSLYILKSLPKQWLMIHTQQTFLNLVCTTFQFLLFRRYSYPAVFCLCCAVCCAVCVLVFCVWSGGVLCWHVVWCAVLCCVCCAVVFLCVSRCSCNEAVSAC